MSLADRDPISSSQREEYVIQTGMRDPFRDWRRPLRFVVEVLAWLGLSGRGPGPECLRGGTADVSAGGADMGRNDTS